MANSRFTPPPAQPLPQRVSADLLTNVLPQTSDTTEATGYPDLDALPGGTTDDLLQDDTEGTATSEAPSSVTVPVPGLGALNFPIVSIPSIPPIPPIPSLDLNSAIQQPTIPGGSLSSYIPPIGSSNVKLDKGDPKVTPATSTSSTVVSAPSQPQHISSEVAAVAPSVAPNLIQQFGQQMLIAAQTTGAHVTDIISGLQAKAGALGDLGAGAFGAGIASAMSGLLSNTDFASAMAGGLASAVNQAMAMVNLRQVPSGIRDPNSLRDPDLKVVSDASHSASWPMTGAAVNPAAAINNNTAIAQDLYNHSVALGMTQQATWNLGTSAHLLSQGLNVPAMGTQLDATLRMMAIHPFNTDGTTASSHSLKYNAALDQATTQLPFQTASSINTHLNNLLNGGSTGAAPGNLMHSAYGSTPTTLPANFLQMLGSKIAGNLGTPYGTDITNYLTDPDISHDSMTSQLALKILAGSPDLNALLQGMLAFQTVVQYILALPTATLTLVQQNVTEVGGPMLTFINAVLAQASVLGDPTNIANNYIKNLFTTTQESTLLTLATDWDSVTPDFTVITNNTLLLVAHAIVDPHTNTLGTTTLSSLITNGPNVIHPFGGHIGPEIAYITATFMALMRLLLLANQFNSAGSLSVGNPTTLGAFTASIDEPTFTTRSRQILNDTVPHTQQISNGGAYTGYVTSLSSASAGGSLPAIVQAGMPSSIQAVQDTTDNLHTHVAISNEMIAQQRGKHSFDTRESANEINVTQENADTQAYVAGSLKHQSDSLKTVVTTSLPGVSGIAKAIGDAGISTKPADRATHVQAVIGDSANALASTTLNKTTGVKLDQSYEGKVNQAKFILQQAGTTLDQEAPILRQAARLMINQAAHLLQEADSIDVRGKWKYEWLDQSYGISTTDFHLMSKGNLTISGNQPNYFGQTGTIIADKQSVKLSANSAAEVSLESNGSINITSSSTIVITVGSSQISISSGRIDLNPTAPVSAPLDTINIQYVAPPAMATVDDIAPSTLPASGNRNPIPCAAPYWRPYDQLAIISNNAGS